MPKWLSRTTARTYIHAHINTSAVHRFWRRGESSGGLTDGCATHRRAQA